MDTLLARYAALGTQAALLAGFAITSLTSLTPADPSVDIRITYIFYITSLMCVLPCMHVVVCTLYVCNWAPGLALRGPTGSLGRAYDASKSEKTQINAFFTLGVISFAFQTMAAIWVTDTVKGPSPHAIYTTTVTILAVIADAVYHSRMHKRFFGRGPQLCKLKSKKKPITAGGGGLRTALLGAGHAESGAPLRAAGSHPHPRANLEAASASVNGGADASSNAGAPSYMRGPGPSSAGRRMAVLDNPVARANIGANPDASVASIEETHGDQDSRVVASSSEFNFSGVLSKKSFEHSATTRTAGALRRMATTIAGGEWRERFVVVQDGVMQVHEAAYAHGMCARIAHSLCWRVRVLHSGMCSPPALPPPALPPPALSSPALPPPSPPITCPPTSCPPTTCPPSVDAYVQMLHLTLE